MNTLHDQLGALAAHVRDPGTQPGPPGIEDRRLKIYRELVFNNLDGLLGGTFPVTRRTLGDADWQALLRCFLRMHRSQTPLFTRLGLEFVEFLQSSPEHAPTPPWLAELAHYEWAELGLQLSDAIPTEHAPGADLLEDMPRLSPLAWPLAYRWPVHRLGPDYQPETPPDVPTLLLLCRDRDGRVQFSLLSPLLYRLLERVAGSGQASGRTLLRALAQEAGQADSDAFLVQAMPILQRLHADGVLTWALC